MPESTLQDFPKVAVSGKITAAEYGAEFIALPSDPDDPINGDKFCDKLSSYRQINPTNLRPTFDHKVPPIRTAPSRQTRSLIMRTNEGVIKGMWDAFRDSGLSGLEEYLRQVARNPAVTVLYGCLSALTSVSEAACRLRKDTMIRLFPHLKLSEETVIEDAAQVRDWKTSWLRAVSWHPQFPKLAFALHDDSIRICDIDEDVLPLLRCREQKNVSCISWRPFARYQLAAAVTDGIVLWDLDNSNLIKPGASSSEFLSAPGHAPVTSVQYSNSGLLLLSSSSFDTSIYVWDVTNLEGIPLTRIGGGGVPLSIWSPNDERILSTTPTKIFRIWERDNKWKPKRWNAPQLPIEAACWTPDGNTLLFASGEMLYAIHFLMNDIEKFINRNTSVAVPLYDLSICDVHSEDGSEGYRVGGHVRKMEIEPGGTRLAVCFDDSELVAVFRVQPKSMYYLAPCGFIRGFPEEYPLTIAFQRDFKDGALLTIAWNSGRLQYFPFLFAPLEGVKNLLHQDHYKLPHGVKSSSKRKSTRASFGASKVVPEPDLGEGDMGRTYVDDEDDFEGAACKTSSFIDSPASPSVHFTSASDEPPHLFSLSHRSPM